MGDTNQFEQKAIRQYGRVPIPWAYHQSDNAADPFISQLIDLAGFEAYGRYWRLVELLLRDPNHVIPNEDERDYKRFMLHLKFDCVDDFNAFIDLLRDYALVEINEYGRLVIPIVEEAAQRVGADRSNGYKGAKARWGNQQRKQG